MKWGYMLWAKERARHLMEPPPVWRTVLDSVLVGALWAEPEH
jgi:hypothetical protein